MTRWQGRIPLFVGVIGHRQLNTGEHKALEQQVLEFLKGLRAGLPSTPIVVLSRLVGDADELAASAALATGCESACVLPLDATTDQTVVGCDAARPESAHLLAASVVLGVPVSASAATDPERARAEAGYFITRHAVLLLALWDGTESDRPGSVGDLIGWRLANSPGHRDATLCYVPVGRAMNLSRTSAKQAIQACGWNQAEQFNAGVFRARLKLAGALEPFTAVPDERVVDVAAVCRAASLRATEVRTDLRRFKVLLQSIVFLAAIAFAVFLKFESLQWALWVYLGLLASALLVRTLIHHRALHRRYLDYRGIAEGLRVALFWRIAGVLAEDGSNYAASRFVWGPDASVGWIGAALTALDGWMGGRPMPKGFDGCEFAARHWLGAPAGGDPGAQIPYYRTSASRLRRLTKVIDRVVNLTLIAGVVSATLLAVLPGVWRGSVVPLLTTVMGFMPLVSGTASAAVDVPAEQETARQYEHMERLLASASERLAVAESDEERRGTLFEVGVAALAEQRTWHAMHGQRAPRGRKRS